MKFLITGGTGLIGKSIVQLLIEKNHEVVLLGIHSDIEKNAYKNIKAEHLKLSMEGFRGVNFIKKLKVFFQIIFDITFLYKTTDFKHNFIFLIFSFQSFVIFQRSLHILFLGVLIL